MFHLFRFSILFLVIRAIFCLSLAPTDKWPESELAPLYVLMFSISVAHLLDTNTRSIWFVSLVPGIFQVPLYMSFLCYQVLRTLKLLVVVYCTNRNPLLLVVSCRICLPMVSLYICSLPNLALKSPSVITASCFGTSSHTFHRIRLLFRPWYLQSVRIH